MNNVTNMVDDLTIILTLGKSTIWVNGETVNIMGRHPTYEENASFAGYVSVQFSSQSNVTVEVSYFSHGVSYENSIIVGSSGTAVFPVLPSSISIYIFQTPFADPYVLSDVYATVTITYYY